MIIHGKIPPGNGSRAMSDKSYTTYQSAIDRNLQLIDSYRHFSFANAEHHTKHYHASMLMRKRQ